VRIHAEEQWRIQRELLRRIKLAFDAEGISPPFAAMAPPALPSEAVPPAKEPERVRGSAPEQTSPSGGPGGERNGDGAPSKG
jgi:hypothetical protein